MSTTNKKNPAGAANANEAIESIPKTSLLAYMGRTGDNTRHSFGTWSGEQMPTIC
ncbi:hypothetical protein [Corynebacterium casei]|uniref:hypothetical protein n=1 Tax=Corynebacterium casei TaxID=160386 RepID=UPI0023F11D1A|nr:hypothetical protein [Corynebacterium casei]